MFKIILMNIKKIQIHYNIPCIRSQIPTIGYLKSLIKKNCSINPDCIYWNLMPSKLYNNFYNAISKTGELIPHSIIDFNYLCQIGYIAKNIYQTNSKMKKKTIVSTILKTPFGNLDELRKIAKQLKEHIDTLLIEKKLYEADIAIFSVKHYQWLLNNYIIYELKKLNPSIKILLIGAQSKNQCYEFLKICDKADFVFWGDYYNHLIDMINNGDSNRIIQPKNNQFMNNKIVIPDNSHFIEPFDINKLYFADHSDFFDTINEYGISIPFELPIIGTHACSWNKCNFCNEYKNINYQERNINSIISEIEYQSKKYDIDNIMFVDADIGRKNEEDFTLLLKSLIDSVIKRNKSYKISGMISPIRLTKNNVDLMNKIVFENVILGFESLSDSILHKMNKKHNITDNIQSLKNSCNAGLNLSLLSIIQGIPNESESDIIESMKNIKFLRYYLNKFVLFPSRFILFRDTFFYSHLEDKSMDKDWNFNPFWSEIQNLDFLSGVDRFEVTGFSRGLTYSYLWDLFSLLLNFYKLKNFSYKWFEYSDGSSFIEEIGTGYKYILNPLETEMLIFCDNKKGLKCIQDHFHGLDINVLGNILKELKNYGLLYYNGHPKSEYISVVSIENKRKL